MDFTLVAVIEAVADLINLYVIDHLGRKTNLVFVLALSGASCLGIGFIPSNLPNTGGVYAGRLILLLLGKFGASSAFATLYVFTRYSC